MTTVAESVVADTVTLHHLVDYVHRYWLRETGCYPKGEDSMAIVLAVAALYELHTLTHTLDIRQGVWR